MRKLAPLYPQGSESAGPSAKPQEKGPAYVLPISEENRRTLESELFTRSYKGVTDLVTKWLWPVPAFWTVRFCVRFGIRPNHVTLLSLVICRTGGSCLLAWLLWYRPGDGMADDLSGHRGWKIGASNGHLKPDWGCARSRAGYYSSAALVYCLGCRVCQRTPPWIPICRY